jgi:hypothetical protein
MPLIFCFLTLGSKVTSFRRGSLTNKVMPDQHTIYLRSKPSEPRAFTLNFGVLIVLQWNKLYLIINFKIDRVTNLIMNKANTTQNYNTKILLPVIFQLIGKYILWL